MLTPHCVHTAVAHRLSPVGNEDSVVLQLTTTFTSRFTRDMAVVPAVAQASAAVHSVVKLPPIVYNQKAKIVPLPPIEAVLKPKASVAQLLPALALVAVMPSAPPPSTVILPPLVFDQTVEVLPPFNTIAAMIPSHQRPTEMPARVVAHVPVVVVGARFEASSMCRLSVHLCSLKRKWRSVDSCGDMSVDFLIAPLASNEQ